MFLYSFGIYLCHFSSNLILLGIGGEGRIIDYGNSTLLKQTLIERHADTIQILQIKQYANLNIKTQLKLKSLMLEDVDSYTLNNVLNNCKDTLESLEINKNNIADIYLPNLRHVRFENCNMSAAFYERYSDNLISLELDYQRINFMKENPRFFTKLKYFTSSCIDNNFPILEYCTSSIECLSVITIVDIHIIPQCIRNLKDLYLHFINKSSIPLIIENYLSLEFLLISDSDASFLEILNKDLYFPKLKTVLLPDFQNNQVLQFFARSCPEDVQIITNDDLAEEIMVRRARSNYPYPRISRSVRFFER